MNRRGERKSRSRHNLNVESSEEEFSNDLERRALTRTGLGKGPGFSARTGGAGEIKLRERSLSGRGGDSSSGQFRFGPGKGKTIVWGTGEPCR